jgi:hypothetical protein
MPQCKREEQKLRANVDASLLKHPTTSLLARNFSKYMNVVISIPGFFLDVIAVL